MNQEVQYQNLNFFKENRNLEIDYHGALKIHLTKKKKTLKQIKLVIMKKLIIVFFLQD